MLYSFTVHSDYARQPLYVNLGRHDAHKDGAAGLLPVHRKRKQDIARRASEAALPGVDVHHAADDRWATAVKRPAARFSAVHGVVVKSRENL